MKSRETNKPILASKELIEMLGNDSVEYDDKTIYNYKKLLYGCLRPELEMYFYNLKSQGWNQSIWNSKIYQKIIKPKIEEMKTKYENANYLFKRKVGNGFGYREMAHTQPIVFLPDKASQLN